MKGSTNFLARAVGVALIVGFAANSFAGDPNKYPREEVDRAPAAVKLNPPLVDWKVDAQAGAKEVRERNLAAGKVGTDKATVFRPVPICRLIDTRDAGTGGAFTLNGPLVAPSNTPVVTNNLCGIPTSGVAGLSISFHALNNTPNNGGFITFLQTGAAVAGVNAVFNVGTQWTAATANVPIPNSSGDFSIVTVQSTIELVVDINGYYQDLDELDIAAQEFDFFGSTTGSSFEVRNTNATGTALTLRNAEGGTALTIGDGKIVVEDAGVDTNEAAFIHRADSSSAFGTLFSSGNLCTATGGLYDHYTVISHPFLNNNPDALVFVTARTSAKNQPYEAYYLGASSCTSAAADNKWSIRGVDGIGLTTPDDFSVLIINHTDD